MARIPRSLAFRYDVLPLTVAGGVLAIAVPDPADGDLLDVLRGTARLPVRPVSLARDLIRDAVRSAYGSDVEHAANADAPAVRLVDELLADAVAAHASDVHVEPQRDAARIRLRIDGVLRDAGSIPVGMLPAVTARLKVLANLDAAERRLPQDGRCTVTFEGRRVDARISTVPAFDGEKVVVRLLDRHGAIPRLPELGMDASALAAFRAAIALPAGFIATCGPTGSGKTTTLYASLGELDADVRNVCSVEDPVELRLPGVTQVQVNRRVGFTFAAALRAFFRQDPGVLMIGELRDEESAAVAASAALTGQLVFTTLHAPDAAGSIDRLVELGIPRGTLASALTAVVAQRLVRVLCEACRILVAAPGRYAPRGCRACGGTGYLGRTGIFEVLLADDAVRDAIAHGSSAVDVRHAARRHDGTRTLRDDGLDKVARGITSTDEIRRVLGDRAP